MYLRYSAGVVAPMQRISPRDSAGLRMLAASSDPFGRSRADQRVQLVDEHDDVRVVGQLLHDRLEALFELTAILRAGDDQRDVERENALVGEKVRHVAVDDLLRQAFDDRRLADARLADQHGVVLGAAAEHLLDPLELVVAADQRIELVLHRRFGQVAAELGQQRRLFDARQRRLLVQQLDDVLAHGVQAHPLFHQDGRRDRPLLAQDAEQQMLGADVVVQQPVGLFGRELEHALGFGAERNLHRGGDFLPEHRAPFDFLADVLEREVRAREDPARQAFAFANQAEQQVLGLDRDAAQLAGFVPGEEKDSSSPFGVPFEHPGYLRENSWCWGLGDDDHIIRHLKGFSPPIWTRGGPRRSLPPVSGARRSAVRLRAAGCDRRRRRAAGCASQ